MGPDKAFDYTRYFIFCANVMGSPYGSLSPVSTILLLYASDEEGDQKPELTSLFSSLPFAPPRCRALLHLFQVTLNPDTGSPWGPECPLTTARDDVR